MPSVEFPTRGTTSRNVKGPGRRDHRCTCRGRTPKPQGAATTVSRARVHAPALHRKSGAKQKRPEESRRRLLPLVCRPALSRRRRRGMFCVLSAKTNRVRDTRDASGARPPPMAPPPLGITTARRCCYKQRLLRLASARLLRPRRFVRN